MGWIALILFLLIVLIVWIALIVNSKKYRPAIHTAEHETAHEIEPEAEHPAEILEEAEAQPEIEAPARTAASAAVAESTVPEAVGEPEPDDLTLIEGIGPKVKSTLVEAGFPTFVLLSKADSGVLKEILEEAKYHYMDPSTWPEQARLAGEGKFAELKAFQETLKTGRKSSETQ